MLLINVWMIFFVSTIESSPTTNQEFPSIIYKIVLGIMNKCLEDQLNPLIVDRETSNYLNYFGNDLKSASIIVMDEFFEINHLHNSNPNKATFILSTQFKQEFNICLSNFQMTPWWHVESLIILIGALNDSCADAQDLLTTAWNKKILSIIYFCHESTKKNQLMLYTFNPFTNRAPDPWKFFKSTQILGNSWTLYNQLYHKEKSICKNLIFDKTRHTAGYKLKVATASIEKIPTIDPELFIAVKPLPFNALISSVLTALNVTIIVYSNESARMINGVMNESLEKLWRGDYDIYLDERPLEIMYHHVTNVLIVSEMAIITQRRPYLTVEEKILLFFHPHALAMIIMLIFISTIILKLYKSQKFIEALLEIFSLFIGTGIRQPLHSAPIRIYFFGVFWLAIILNGTFQGNLAVLLTRPKRLSVETINDLKKLDYQTYGTKTWLAVHQWRLSSLKQNCIHNFPDSHYDDHMINDTKVAIIGPASQLYKIAKKQKLHLSSPVGSVYAVWWTSPNFLFKNRLNWMILNCQASGLISFWKKEGYTNTRKKLIAEEINETRARIRPINLNDLFFAFKLLILGLGCSLFVFIVEFKINLSQVYIKLRHIF